MSAFSFIICLGLTTAVSFANPTAPAASPSEPPSASKNASSPNPKSLPDELIKRAQALEVELGKLENQMKGAAVEQAKAKLLSHWKPRFSCNEQAPAGAGLDVWVSAVAREPALGELADSVELLRAYDADKDPMRRHSGQPGVVAGSHNSTPIVDRNPAMIMLWGPYAALEPGRYAVVYRVQFLEAEGEAANQPADSSYSGGFFDACTNAVTYSGRRPVAKSMPSGAWHSVGVPITVADKREFEFRFWPDGRDVAVDRIYLYRLDPKPAQEVRPPQVSIMGAVNCPGTFPHAKCNTLASLLEACGGINHMGNPSVAILNSQGKSERLTLDDSNRNRLLQPEDVVEIPEK